MFRLIHPFLIFLFIGNTPLNGQSELISRIKIPPVVLDNLVQGRIYSPDYIQIKGSQYLTKTWAMGNIQIQDHTYRDLPVWYDIYADELVLLYSVKGSLSLIQLPKAHTLAFTFDNRSFVNSALGKYKESGLKKGYFEVIFRGRADLLIERNLELKKENSIASFNRKDRIYYVVQNKAHRVRSKKSLLELFDQKHHKPIGNYFKKQKIRLKKASDTQLKQLASYIDVLLSEEVESNL